MRRRQYLTGVGLGTTIIPGSSVSGATDHVSVEILDTNVPLEAGNTLDVTAAIENSGNVSERVEIEFIVGEDPETISRRTVPVGAGDTRIVDTLQFRTYPVPADDSFPIYVETANQTAETTVHVTGIDEFDSQYATPAREIAVEPDTSILFEVDSTVLDQSSTTYWYHDGEYAGMSSGPWFGVYSSEVGADFWSQTFETSGSHEIVAVVVSENSENTRHRWEVSVGSDGMAPPNVETIRPATEVVPTDGDYELALDVVSSGTNLDSVVWWLTQADVILGISDIDGQEDTAAIRETGCHTCHIEAWVLDEHNIRTRVMPWRFDDSASLDDTGDDTESSGEVDITILESNDPVTGGEILDVIADIENTTGDELTRDVEFIVGETPEVVDTQTVSIAPDASRTVEFSFETYPVAINDRFPVRVETTGSADEQDVLVYGTD